MKKLSFKEYVASKQKLRETATSAYCKASYSTTKYCRLIIGEKTSKSILSLKPKQKITIEWFTPNKLKTPEPISIMFEGMENTDIDTFTTYWSGDKLLSWLKKNTIQKID